MLKISHRDAGEHFVKTKKLLERVVEAITTVAEFAIGAIPLGHRLVHHHHAQRTLFGGVRGRPHAEFHLGIFARTIRRLRRLHVDVQFGVVWIRHRPHRNCVALLRALGITDERYATVIDESAHVPVSCAIGSGSIVFAHAVLTTDIEVGPHVVIMPNATLTHDNRISHYATICAGVSLGGAVEVGPAAYLGMNSSVRENLKIGATAVLGMGAVLLSDLPAGETWVGVPAAPVGLATKISPSPRNPHVQDALA